MTVPRSRPLVLIVDDDQDTREMYALFLTVSGVDVIEANAVDPAIELARDRQPDVVVTDLLFGGSGTGSDLCRLLRQDERTAHIPALVLTGWSGTADEEAATLAGCVGVRTKPYLPDALLNDIRDILGRAQGERLAG
jgi:two-component system cell cycle response regulator DivK